MADPTPSPSSTRWGGSGTGWSPTGTSSPTPVGTSSPSPVSTGLPFGTGTSTVTGKARPAYVFYDPRTGRLTYGQGTPAPPSSFAKSNPGSGSDLQYVALSPETKAYLQDIAEGTTRPSGYKWGTAVDVWRYAQNQRRASGGSVWDALDEIAATAPRSGGSGPWKTSETPSGRVKGTDNLGPGGEDDPLANEEEGTAQQFVPPTPTTNTATYKTISSFTAADADSLMTSALTNAIGREPTAREVRAFLGKLRSAARKNPSTSTTTTRNDGYGNTSSTTKQHPGFDATGAQVLAKDVSEGGAFEKERRQYTANTMFNAFLSAIQSPTDV